MRRIISSKRKQLINLFESNIVNELIEANALTIGEDIVPLFNEIEDNGLKTIND